MRSGVSNVNLSYSTTGLDIGTGPVSASTASIEYSSRNDVTIVVDGVESKLGEVAVVGLDKSGFRYIVQLHSDRATSKSRNSEHCAIQVRR